MAAMVPATLDLDFYVSSTDGPTLRMTGTSVGIRRLRTICELLAGGKLVIRLSDLDDVRLSANVAAVKFRLGGTDGLCRRTGDPPCFVFDGDNVHWEARARLLDLLVIPGRVGTFQFLEPNNDDGICVEVEVTR
jgi:hypothetical protein